jgi:hypothetical protein
MIKFEPIDDYNCKIYFGREAEMYLGFLRHSKVANRVVLSVTEGVMLSRDALVSIADKIKYMEDCLGADL